MSYLSIIRTILSVILCSTQVKNVILWPNHDISTLKLLQIVHRHGDRAITKLYPNDPFNNLTAYWPEGLAELSNDGKYRMYKLGQFIRNQYQQYLGQDYSPREVYARSSAKSRCLDSIAALLSGAYPPDNSKWQWNKGTDGELGRHWQPFPIETFLPMNDDRLLRTEAYCPKVTEAMDNIFNSERIQTVLKDNEEFLTDLGERIGVKMVTLLDVKNVQDHLWTEYERGYKWSDLGKWSKEYEENALKRLLPLTELLWITEWNNSVIQRTRAGILVQELVHNIENRIKTDDFAEKMFVYSTHDATVAVLMHSLGVFNDQIIPLSASLFFELHRKTDSDYYFVRLYYYNQTLTDQSPHLLLSPKCDYLGDCPIDKFLKLTQDIIPQDWNKECGIDQSSDGKLFSALNIVILTANSVLILISILLITVNICLFRKRASYETVE